MEARVNELAEKVWKRFREHSENQRFMIAISGIPGSGKTTLSQIITDRLNRRYAALHPDAGAIAAFVPMDGYHLTRAQLSAMPDPVTAHARRGAEFTFDSPVYSKLVVQLRRSLTDKSQTIYAPSFDHAVKDPVENAIPIKPQHRIIVFEGNYLCLDKQPWNTAADVMDERWFVEVDFDVARQRLVKRHVKAGIAKNEIEAGRRADANDLVNGREIVENKYKIDEVIISREDEAWKHD